MKGFDVLKVKSAVKTRNQFDLSHSHLTTMNFGEIVPMLAEEVIPGDKFSINSEYFSRMAPLVKPTYGQFSFKTCTAFIPYHQLAVDSDAWLAGKTTWEGQSPHHRYFTVQTLALYIANYCVTTVGATSANTQFTYVNSSGVRTYSTFTKVGKYYVKILNALGYAIPQNADFSSGSAFSTSAGLVKLSAYPLLAFFKLYNDYMSQSQRFNSSPLSTFLQNVKYGRTQTGYTPSSGAIDQTGLNIMFTNLYLNYENDYFTTAWQQPNNAINSVENISGIAVPTAPSVQNLGTVVDGLADNTLQLGVQSSLVSLGQRALDFLKSFDDWVRRNNYSGSRAVQQIYSRFGIKTDDYKSHYANVLSTDVLPVQVGDVTATADASGVPLGDYAGKGIMNGSKGVSCEVSDYGIILILGYFTVRPMNSYGFDKRVLRSSPLDYYNPEFDGIGAEAISLGEVFANPIAGTTDTTADNQVFGYTERYNAYRYGRDVITGEFRDYNNVGDMNVWHTGRLLGDIRAAGNLVAQSTSMNTLPQIDSEYNRIFSVTSGSVDHFYVTARFNINAVRPMLNLNQVVKLGEGSTTVPRNGNVIS